MRGLSYFIAQRLAFGEHKSFSKSIVKIAITGIAVSMTVMIISIVVLAGFKREIQSKVTGFGGHVEVKDIDASHNYDYPIMEISDKVRDELGQFDFVHHIQKVLTKPGILKSNDEIEGIIVKGIAPDFDSTFYAKSLVEGSFFNTNDTAYTRKAVISKNISERLKLNIGDKIRIYFIGERVKAIALNICGIYSTGIEEHDKVMVLTDIKHLQRIFAKKQPKYSHFEVFLDNMDDLEAKTNKLKMALPENLRTENVKELNENIFSWLRYLDDNTLIVLILMMFVSFTNLSTALLVLILERINMIGVLKSLGMSNWQTIKIFVYQSMHILFWGIIIGNVIGLGFALLQQKFGFLLLPEETYYISKVMIYVNWTHMLLLNLGVIVLSIIVMLLPASLAASIKPVKAIKFN